MSFYATAQKANTTEPVVKQIAEASKTTTVKWLSIEEAAKLNAKEPRKLFIDVYTDQCRWCKIMDNNTFSVADVAEYLNTHFYPVKLNAESRSPINFVGQIFNFNPQYRFQELAVAILQGQMNFPSIAYMDEQLQLITVVPGYQKPEDIRPILVYFAQDYYKKLNWETFQKEWPQLQKALEEKNN
jgi:thioredoxin-related protein